MRLPDDYNDRSGMSPAVVMSIVAVTLFVAAVFVAVLLANSSRRGGRDNRTPSENSSPIIAESASEDGAGEASSEGLRPEDLDFWDMYPVQETQEPAEETPIPQETVENDPATDGRHTKVTNPDGSEDWVLISPYLPKHEYDFTQLVCQSGIMKYYRDGSQVSYEGIELSEVQDYVDFTAVKKAGTDFVMLRAGTRGYGTGQLVVDDYFADNLRRASDAGLEVGVYFYSQAITEEEAVEEANLVLESIGEYRISYPVAYVTERIVNDSARTDVLTKTERTAIAKAFLDTVQEAGYKALLYGSKEWLIRQIDMSKLTAYDVWLAQAEDIPDYPYRFNMWQYSTEGRIDGVSGYVNLDISFVDYSEK